MQQRVVPPQIDQLGAAVDQELDPFGQRVELPQQRDPRRLQRVAQRRFGSRALDRSRSFGECAAAPVDRGVVDIELAREQAQKALAAAWR